MEIRVLSTSEANRPWLISVFTEDTYVKEECPVTLSKLHTLATAHDDQSLSMARRYRKSKETET